LVGTFTEFGPFEIVKNENGTYSEKERKVSWNDDAHLLVVDNPVGTGLSYGAPGELVNTTEMMADYLYNGLKNLFSLTGEKNTCNM